MWSKLSRVVMALSPLLVGVGVLVGSWLRYPRDYEISDPSSYARNAYWVSRGTFLENGIWNHIFQHRFGVFVPVGILYRLFGVSPKTTDLAPLLAAIVVLGVVWSVLSDRARWFGVLATVSCRPFIEATTVLFPDLILTAFLMLSVWALSWRTRFEHSRARLVLGAASGVTAWFCAFLTNSLPVAVGRTPR